MAIIELVAAIKFFERKNKKNCEVLTTNKKRGTMNDMSDKKEQQLITELSQEQIDKFPFYVKKWTDIGMNNEPCNFKEAKKWVIEAYKVAKLAPPKFFFHFKSPEASAHAIFMIDALSTFDSSYQSTEVYGNTDDWMSIFDNMWEQYKAQADNKAWYKKFAKQTGVSAWDDSAKARMLSCVSKAYAETDHVQKRKSHLQSMLYGSHDAAWLSFYDFFYQEFDLECTHDLIPSFEIAKNCGWWSAYEEVAILQDRPTEIHITEDNILHREDGPCIVYGDGSEVYCLENFWFPKLVVMNPEQITPEMVRNESNAEKRRILLQRYGGADVDNGGGYLKFFEEVGAKVIDRDFVVVDPEEKTTMPRCLVECDFNGQSDLFLVGSDGSTERVYIMPVSNRDRVENRMGGKITTCKQAHQLISGLDESKCVAQS
jgi:hypothetical protein